ncbi:uncharacterized protein H6S33_009518 [Morchella sextelata]|uniref:uncharacterized protein n=1 Tax=Morchella sextelata TaxID=1174677 RepID=UPI001D0377CC|nr:uncharacterized protein H6S33_009518 [Morchella sextelata]KAH0613138.1 hypothetical protein H6S33_009518 [Morchella sextelata]
MAPRKSNPPLCVIDLTEDSPNLEPQPVYAAPAPAPKRAGRKRKIDLADTDNSLVPIPYQQQAGYEPRADIEIIGFKPTSTKPRGVGKGKEVAGPSSAKAPSIKKAKNTPAAEEEKRLGRWRSQPTHQLRDRIHRCLTQRMVVLDRHRNMEVSPPEEIFQIAGSTGNVYQVHIKRKSTCSCPDGIQNGLCKHILYVMMKVLKARDELVYQPALLSTELEQIFLKAPAAPASDLSNSGPSNRKPLEDDDCPICYSEFDNEESTVYCKSQCGTNIHEACFRQWAATKGPGLVTCVMCRQPWQSENVKSALVNGKIGEEGYVNVAEQLGMSLERDTSTYAPGFGAYGGHGYRRRGYW